MKKSWKSKYSNYTGALPMNLLQKEFSMRVKKALLWNGYTGEYPTHAKWRAMRCMELLRVRKAITHTSY